MFVACFLVTFGERVCYDNYRVYSVKIENDKHLKFLQNLKNDQNVISFLNPPTTISQNADILVPPHKISNIIDLFEAYDIENVIKMENLRKYVVDLTFKY